MLAFGKAEGQDAKEEAKEGQEQHEEQGQGGRTKKAKSDEGGWEGAGE